MLVVERIRRVVFWTALISLIAAGALALMLAIGWVLVFTDDFKASPAQIQEWKSWTECDSIAKHWAEVGKLEPIGDCADIGGWPGRFQENAHPYLFRVQIPPDWSALKCVSAPC